MQMEMQAGHLLTSSRAPRGGLPLVMMYSCPLVSPWQGYGTLQGPKWACAGSLL